MKTKKIIAESMPLALKMVRQELGDNAIIVNNRTIKTNGLFGFFAKQQYEVTAYSVDQEEAPREPKFSLELKEKMEKMNAEKSKPELKTEEPDNKPSIFHQKPQQLYQYYSQQNTEEEKTAPAVPEPKEKENPMLDELKQMRKMMMNFIMNDQQETSQHSGLGKWINQLKKQGVVQDVIDHIVERVLRKHESINDLDERTIKKEFTSIIIEMIERRIPTSNTIDEEKQIIHMIGPTGVGKTTSIAKLATEQVLKQKRKVAMITTDVYRIAAVEQLKTYAVILNVPIEVVRSSAELDQALQRLEHYDLIYMDTTGRNYKEIKNRESINEFLNHPLKSDNYLVVSLTTKYEDLQTLLQEFLDSPVKKLILTKFDETTSYGSILNIAYHYPYQLTYITNGQSVPEDITTIDARQLANDLLGEER